VGAEAELQTFLTSALARGVEVIDLFCILHSDIISGTY